MARSGMKTVGHLKTARLVMIAGLIRDITITQVVTLKDVRNAVVNSSVAVVLANNTNPRRMK
jgi:hypothetical protein